MAISEGAFSKAPSVFDEPRSCEMTTAMETSRTLLEKLKVDHADEAWDTFFKLYMPLIQNWLERHGVASSDVPDLSQEVFLALANDLPNFQHSGNIGAFRTWLKMVVLNRCRRYWEARKKNSVVGSEAARELLDQLESPDSSLARQWDQEHDQHILRELLHQIQQDFTEPTLLMFQRTAIEGIDAKTVASELSVNVGQVYKAKFRVMTRLQQEASRVFEEVAVFLSTRRPG